MRQVVPDVYLMEYTHMTHNDFHSNGILVRARAGDHESEVTWQKDQGFLAIMQYTRAFLDAYLKGQDEGMKLLESALRGENGSADIFEMKRFENAAPTLETGGGS